MVGLLLKLTVSQRQHTGRRLRRVGGVAAAAILVLMAVWPGAPLRGQGADGFPRTVIDAEGAAITIPSYPARVAVLGTLPALAHILTPDERVSIDPAVSPAGIEWQGAGVLLVPELFAVAYPGHLAAARAAGVPVFQVGPVHSMRDWVAQIALLGRVTGREARAAAAIRSVVAAVAASRSRRCMPLDVLVLTPEAYTFGDGTLITDLIRLAGGENAAAAAGYADFRQIDDVAVRALDPDVLLLSAAWGTEGAAYLLNAPVYAEVEAVRAGRVFVLPFSPTVPRDPALDMRWLTQRVCWRSPLAALLPPLHRR